MSVNLMIGSVRHTVVSGDVRDTAALLGAALLMIHFGAGPFSVDARRDRSEVDADDLRQRRNAA